MATTTAASSHTTTGTTARTVRAGQAITVLVTAFMLFDGLIHVLETEAGVEGLADLGFARSTSVTIGALNLAALALYVHPRTAVLGALLLTAYLGGAFAAQLRVDAPIASTQLFSVYVGVAGWAGLWLRDERVRALIPLRQR